MKVTNNSGLPDALVAAIEADGYTKGDADFSITELLSPPRIASLKAKHKDDIIEDAEDRLWSLYGQIAHSILERANRKGIAEKRYFANIGGARISGQIDTLDLDGGTLSDWKFVTSYKFKKNQGVPPEWEAQLNYQLELFRHNGLDAKALQIVGLLRDFSKMEAKRDFDYPQAPVVIMPIPMWPREKTWAHMTQRITAHKEARESLPLCSDDDRWARPTVYAVKKKDQKKAVRLYGTHDEAVAHASVEPGLKVEVRPGEFIRCDNY